MYSKVLVPLDGSKFSEQILPLVRRIAEAMLIPVELLLVTEPDARPPLSTQPPVSDYLESVEKKYFAAPTRVIRIAARGKPADVIIDHAEAEHSCLIAMATHGMTGLRRWLLGGVASKIVQSSQNPLLLMRPNDDAAQVALDTVFVPLDGSALAEQALPHVAGLAKAMKLEINLVRVYTLPTTGFLVGEAIIAQDSNRLRDEIRREAETYIDGKVDEMRGEGLANVIATIIEGDPASEIIDLGLKTPNDLIVMSTHGRSGLERWALGSVAEKVVQLSRDPVLLVRGP